MSRVAGAPSAPMDKSSTLSPERFEQRLARVRVDDPGPADVRSAVAALLRFDRGVPDVLLMKRVERADDHWSGHISLPGGRESPDDPDLLATAMRETHEEVGVDLRAGARLIGRLQPLRAVAAGRVRSMIIMPYVFVQTGPVTIELGHEAADAFWFPLDRAASGELSQEYRYVLPSETRVLPSWRYGDHVVWGLTYRMLDDLLGLVVRD